MEPLTLTRFEFKTVDINLLIPGARSKSEKELESLGRDGWIIRATCARGAGGAAIVFLQRPIP